MRIVIAVAAVGALLAGCSNPLEKYAAEVGYYEGAETKWEIWGDLGLEDCKNAAISRYNFYFSQGRADSWSCLKKNASGGYESRHR